MEKIKILVVEDERITAEDIRLSLMNLGYDVTALVSSGEDALREVEKYQPDLILMDIVLQGNMDGIVTADKILSHYNIPIVYTTAYSDERTLERVKKTEPFGYILKPFEDQELQGIIEVALYKHELERRLRDSEEKFRSLYETMAQGVIYMDAGGEVVSVNPAALNILKMNEEEIRKQWSGNYHLKVFHEDGTEFIKKDLPLLRALRTGKENHNIIFGIYPAEGKDIIWLKTSAVPQFKPGEKKPYQAYLTFDDISERKKSEDALIKYTAQLSALRKIAQELTGLRDLDTLLQHILELGVQILGGLGGGIYLYHPATDSLEWVVAVNIEKKYLGLTMQRGEGVAGKVLKTGQPIIIQDYSKWPGRLEKLSDYSASIVAVPIRQEREFLGVLSVRVGEPGNEVTSESTELLSQFATQAAIAIQNARLFKEERHRTSQIEAMARIAEKINSILKLDELLKETVETIVDTFEYFYAAIMLMDEDSEELVFYSGAGGFAGKTPPGFRQNLKEGMIGWAAHSKKTILANDVSKEPRYIPAHLSETRSELDVPIIYRDQVIGVLDIQSKELNVFNDEDVRTLETLARHIAVAIENARLYEKAQHEIKQRIHAEDNIEQQTEAMETSMDGMAILDKKEKYVYLNQAHAKAYGYDKVEDLLGKTWRVLYNKKEIARFERQIFPMMRKEGHWCGEAVGKRRDGSCFDQEVSLSSLKDGGLVCVVRDITDRKKVEEGLYESEERLQTTLDSMGDAIHVVNKDLKIILHNKRSTEWYKKLGIPEDIIGKNLFDVFPFLPNKVRSEYRQVFKSGEPLVTEEQTLLDGKKIYTETRKIPFFEHKKVNGVITVVRDITDSKQVIEELIVSEERFRSLFENATIGIYRTTPDGKIVMANPALIRLLGYTSYVELANRNLEKEGFEPTYSRKSFKKMIEEKGEIRGLEAAWKRKDGTTIYIRESAKVFRDENGQLLYYEGTVEDITERKLAEQALQESESKLVAMTNSVSEAIVLMDSDGKVAFWNGAAEKLFGYTHEEAIGKKTIELFAIEKDTSSTYENGLDIFTKSGSESIVGKTLEFQAVKKDGTLFPMEVSVSTLELRDEWYATGIIRDITERKQIEDALRESEERYRGVVEDQTELICRFKSNGTLTFVNKAYCDYFGKNRDDLIGSHFIPLIPSEDQRTVEKNISTLSIEKPLLIHEHRVLKKDNTLGWLRWTNRGFFNQRNEIIEIQAVGSDITIRKRAEERLKDLLEEKEVLLKEVYHRVKNNFQVVTSLLNLQARNIKDTATRQIFMESRDRVRTMAMVHERLYESKDLSKLQFAEYIKTLTKNLIRSYGPGKKKVTINSEIEDIPMSIDQAIPCGLVLNELISNALKYAFPEDWKGNAELSIIFKKNSSNQIEMMVRDNGVGLPADFIFEQTESLGLHLVQILVEDQLHGTIKLVKRGGTKYRILFKKS